MPITADFWDGTQVNCLADPGYESGARSAQILLFALGADGRLPIVTPAISGNYSGGMTLTTAAPGPIVQMLAGDATPAAPGQAWSFAALAAGNAQAGVVPMITLCFLSSLELQISAGGSLLMSETLPMSEALAMSDNTAGGFSVLTGLLSNTLAVGSPDGISNPTISGQIAPDGTRYVAAFTGIIGDTGQTGSVTFDDRVLTQTPAAVSYFSGDDGGAYWQAGRFTSYSQRYGVSTEEAWLRTLAPPYMFSAPADAIQPSYLP